MDTKAQVLAWVNQLRAEHRLGEPLTELPKGEHCNHIACPIAVALKGASVTSHDVRLRFLALDEVECQLPDVVREFVLAFDGGDYPELSA